MASVMEKQMSAGGKQQAENGKKLLKNCWTTGPAIVRMLVLAKIEAVMTIETTR